MVRPFARHYDSIYSDKDYDADLKVLSTLCGHRDMSDKRVLEIGAGTGSHTIRLAPRLKELVSLEIDPDFAELSRQKVEAAGITNVRLGSRPIEQLDDDKFDGAAAFFHVLNYVAPTHRSSFLGALAARLAPGAWFVTDLWNGDAVVRDPPRHETRNKTVGITAIRQEISPTVDLGLNTVTLAYDIDIRRCDGIEHFAEELKLYIWPLHDLEGMLLDAGFSNVQFWDCRRFPAAATRDSWRVWMRAIRR
ncbi:MAG: class I SAM-dependent methyltransferase [Reyranella sp.]|jgi:predicted O-methyltransferase YrrM|nr:class I SAM-dependent methyltransferase [Reyranella sp.]